MDNPALSLRVDHNAWTSHLGSVLKELDHTIHSPDYTAAVLFCAHLDDYGIMMAQFREYFCVAKSLEGWLIIPGDEVTKYSSPIKMGVRLLYGCSCVLKNAILFLSGLLT
ncbi:hypothetical protein [Desulfosporosinus sp. BICA1-9]|uniref:hypothetical protein n=1 Tax=Desulfosporosinus sp. BICA1-9 TaxID=1531958 RepID=UPI00054C5E4A|nr:hypothetical protein [Desulfosporosinus sp. BICA1-9]KJS46856.1 MAG: hypothetical protein VR66_22930 [Peptococcaceae bacterium BRH_c23]KJS81865.1 MAG: hypothetical protein JL57_25860 [Desulfosporosinus sp. BICA1-9]HBW38813.1 hypothetical protein [Desulfosporosinus sp.]